MDKKRFNFTKLIGFNIYTIALVLIVFIGGVGITYAYYAFSYEEESVIVGNVINIDIDLEVDLVVGTNEEMVPLNDEALSNALNGVGSPNGACIDKLGNLSCQVYKITLINKGSRVKHITGTVELYAKEGTGNVYNNLKWRELSDTTTIKDDSVVNGMNKSVLAYDLTIESKKTNVWYIAVWISEIGDDQRETDKGQFGGTVTFEDSESTIGVGSVNVPNLDNGGLIPVYYDEFGIASDGSVGVWRKARISNSDNSWYNYDEKRWANAVMISDSTKRSTYQQAAIDTLIPISDISAFFVWIPRFKYKVWNITRQPGDETSYAYPAYTDGIEIVWEKGISSTGNVSCTYNIETSESITNLSDECKVNDTLITVESGNTNFTNAYYTHPAFTFGGTDKTGFWIGKFETTGTASSPTILPDLVSLNNQNVSLQFTTSKKFQNYGISDNVDAHMLTNLEWGAVAYLTHSMYGLCDDTSCRSTYSNNSTNYITGRSSGSLSPNSTPSTYGDYSYRGYSVSSDGSLLDTKDVSFVASTTGNIYGIYDMTGGSAEYVMGNMVNSNNSFYPRYSGTDWNGSTSLNKKYYNSYSYGIDKYLFNRARLGDATAEVTSVNTDNNNRSSWAPDVTMGGAYSNFLADDSKIWFERGGSANFQTGGLFHFYGFDGSASGFEDDGSSAKLTFRVSIS